METKRTKTQFWILLILTVILLLLPSLGFAAEFWTLKANMPTPRRGLSCSVVDGKIYAIGGADSRNDGVSSVEAYDPAMNQWTTKASMKASIPTGRVGMSTSVVDGKIYAIGGSAGFPIFYLVEAYDPVTDTWTRKADLPSPRFALASAVVDGRIYAIGGKEAHFEQAGP